MCVCGTCFDILSSDAIHTSAYFLHTHFILKRHDDKRIYRKKRNKKRRKGRPDIEGDLRHALKGWLGLGIRIGERERERAPLQSYRRPPPTNTFDAPPLFLNVSTSHLPIFNSCPTARAPLRLTFCLAFPRSLFLSIALCVFSFDVRRIKVEDHQSERLQLEAVACWQRRAQAESRTTKLPRQIRSGATCQGQNCLMWENAQIYLGHKNGISLHDFLWRRDVKTWQIWQWWEEQNGSLILDEIPHAPKA